MKYKFAVFCVRARDVEIDLAKAGVRAIQLEAEKHGIAFD